MRPFRLQPGEYMLPRAKNMKDCNAPEFVEKLNRGPVLIMTVIPNGPMSMSRPLVQWFIFVVVVSVLTAYLAARDASRGRALPGRVPRRGHDGVHRVRRGRLAAVDLVPPSLVDDAEVHARRADLRPADGRRLRMVVAHGVSIVATSDGACGLRARRVQRGVLAGIGARRFSSVPSRWRPKPAGKPCWWTSASVTGREPTMAERYELAVCVADAQAAHEAADPPRVARPRAHDPSGALRRDRRRQPRRRHARFHRRGAGAGLAA